GAGCRAGRGARRAAARRAGRRWRRRVGRSCRTSVESGGLGAGAGELAQLPVALDDRGGVDAPPVRRRGAEPLAPRQPAVVDAGADGEHLGAGEPVVAARGDVAAAARAGDRRRWGGRVDGGEGLRGRERGRGEDGAVLVEQFDDGLGGGYRRRSRKRLAQRRALACGMPVSASICRQERPRARRDTISCPRVDISEVLSATLRARSITSLNGTSSSGSLGALSSGSVVMI